MLRNTEGLVLHTTKYSETSVVAKIFTRELGVRSYLIKGVRSAGGRNKQNLLQPLSHLELTVYDNPKRNLQYIKEMRPARHYNRLDGDSIGMALVFFMDEVLYKSLREAEPNEALFDYTVGQLGALNGDEESDTQPVADGGPLPGNDAAWRHQRATMPIRFLISTADLLGIAPLDNYSLHEPLFNLKEGRFLAPPRAFDANPNGHYFLNASASSHLHHFLQGARHRQPLPALSAAQRRATLDNLLEYYEIHLVEFKNFKSHEVFHAVLQ